MSESDKEVETGIPSTSSAASPVETAEDREARKVAATEAAVAREVAPTIEGHTGVMESEDGPIVLFGIGEYAHTPIKQVPSWYLAHLMGDAVDGLKWRQLTKEQQGAVKKERDRRAGVVQKAMDSGVATSPPPIKSSLETEQEAQAKAASGIDVPAGAQAPTVGEGESKAEGSGTVPGAGSDSGVDTATATDADATSGITTDEAKAVADGTVDDAKTLISKASTKRQLKSIESAEGKRDGGARIGVTAAIEKRRAELDAE